MIRVIDIETTGTDPVRDVIIEITSVDMVRGGGITRHRAEVLLKHAQLPNQPSRPAERGFRPPS